MNIQPIPVVRDVLKGFKTAVCAFAGVVTFAYVWCTIAFSLLKMLVLSQEGHNLDHSLLYILTPDVSMLCAAELLTTCALLSVIPVLLVNQTRFEKMMRDRDDQRQRSPIVRKLKPVLSYSEKLLPFILALRETRIGSVSYAVTIVLISVILFSGLNYLGFSFLPIPHIAIVSGPK